MSKKIAAAFLMFGFFSIPLVYADKETAKVQKFEFVGVKKTPPDELKRISSKYIQSPLYGDWTDGMIAEILKIPIVKDVHLMRNMSGSVTIQIVEKEPIAYLFLDRYYWIDEQGKIIQSIASNRLESKVFFSGPWKNVSEYEKKNAQAALAGGIELYSDLISKGFPEKNISEVHFDANLGWIMYRIGSRAPVVFGIQNFPEKIERFLQVVPRMEPMEGAISKVDADFHDRVVVKLTSVSK